jgi:hypothetical protein
VTAPAEVEYTTWYEPMRDRGETRTCAGCCNPAVGHTTYYDGDRYKVLPHCEIHLPREGGGQL